MSYIAPVDVQLDCDDKTMVEPDVIILCDRSKDINRCIYGAPDFVAEVLSKSTRRKDIGVKTYKYANAGVREYWMIDPKDMKVIVYTFAQNDDAEDTVSIFGFQDKIPVGIITGNLKLILLKSVKGWKQIISVKFLTRTIISYKMNLNAMTKTVGYL